MNFIVKRSKWLRGEGSLVSSLLRPSDGKQCCLGFLAIASGCSIEDITKKGHPRSLTTGSWPHSFNGWGCIICINDDNIITDKEREEYLAEAFRVRGFEVEFVD